MNESGLKMNYNIDEEGFYGEFGGSYIPEMLHKNVEELRLNYLSIINSANFKSEFEKLLKTFVGRPTPLYHAKRLSEKNGARIFLKREDLAHTGAHKINNTIGQILLARKLGKSKIIGETGAGQHGVSTATVCSLMSLPCKVFMGIKDMERQEVNVRKMQLLGAEVIAVRSGSMTLKDATNEALRFWINNPDAHYVIGSVVGPHPYPDMVARFQSVISSEIQRQLAEEEINAPDFVIACVGGGSNAAGAFYHYLDHRNVKLIGVEAAGEGLDSGKSAATTALGRPGVLHGMKSMVMQSSDGQILEAHSISAGLDYPGVGPMLAMLAKANRVRFMTATDDEAIKAGINLSRMEGIIPALESAHALAALNKIEFHQDETIVVNLSGRGDKDLEIYTKYGKS